MSEITQPVEQPIAHTLIVDDEPGIHQMLSLYF